MSKKDGGPAYPGKVRNPELGKAIRENTGMFIKDAQELASLEPGMSFRDRAAIAVLQGFLSNDTAIATLVQENPNLSSKQLIGVISKSAYNYADAMVEEKEKRDAQDK